MLISSQLDTYQLGRLIGTSPPYDDPTSTAFVDSYAQKVACRLAENNNGIVITNERRVIFTWRKYNHAVSVSDSFSSLSNENGDTQAQALIEFLAEPPLTSPRLWGVIPNGCSLPGTQIDGLPTLVLAVGVAGGISIFIIISFIVSRHRLCFCAQKLTIAKS